MVLGTAGHIDHGKSALIEALCGDHPDRWQEERERGITLDLGYAEMGYPDGLEIGFVDVPGHEKLVRKMVAGATGMGAAVLVVACDDGVMPQTREHFEVLGLLGIDQGLVALTKVDLADEEMLELVRADVEELVQDTPWQECAVLPVSAHSGSGMLELKQELRRLAESARSQADPLQAFRLPVQRSFALHGAGTVATGVCAAGRLQEGDTVEVHPGGHSSRVRRVHVHGRQAGVAGPGLRTALNLPALEAAQCPRGVVLAAPGSLRSGRLLRLWCRFLPDGPKLAHGAEVQLLSGTAAVGGRLFLPPAAQGGELPVDGCLVDLELEHAAALVPGQRLLLRRPSPARNIAAGRFLCFARRRLRRSDDDERAQLMRVVEALDDPPQLAAVQLEILGGERGPAELALQLGWTTQGAAEVLGQAAQAGAVREMAAGSFLAMGGANALAREVQSVLAHWRARQPHRLRLPVARLRERLGKDAFQSLQKLGHAELESLGLERRPGTHWGLAGAEVESAWQQDGARVAEILRNAGLAPASAEELAQQAAVEPARLDLVLEYLNDRGEVLSPGSGLYFTRAVIEDLRDAVVEQLQAEGMDIPALRDRFGTTRKFLMPLLEFLDERGVTLRRGPKRILKDPAAPLD